MLLLLLLAGLVTAAVLLLRGGDPAPVPPGPSVHLASSPVTSVSLPPSGHFSSLGVAGGRLILSGGPPYSVPTSGYETTLADGRATGTCHAAIVDPRTLAIGRVRSANCGDPGLYGERVLPVAYLVRRAGVDGAGVGTIAVRIARSDAAARDGYALGPVVTSYPQCSDCQIAWIYGDGSLWLYNPLAAPRRTRGLVLRISERSGAILQRWSMPEIIRALLAVDADGMWLSPSVESGFPGHLTNSQRVPYESLYRLAPGARSARRVLTEPGGDARWLVAAGHVATAAIDTGRDASTIWTFTGRRRGVRGRTLSDAVLGAEFGNGGATYAGNEAIGFYDVVLGAGTERVVRVGPGGRGAGTVATVRAPDVSLDDPPPAGVALDGSFFFLDPPTTRSQISLALHRVDPR